MDPPYPFALAVLLRQVAQLRRHRRRTWQPAIDEATRRSSAFADRYASHYLAAVRCLTDTLPELTMHLRFPDEHWRRIAARTLSSGPW